MNIEIDLMKPPAIPLTENNDSYDYCKREYRKVLLNTLIHLKSKYCLEIGTHLYQSSKVFAYYFAKYQPEGKLITIDISQWTRKEIPPDNVYPVMVYPHSLDVCQHHGNISIYHSDWKENHDSLTTNIKIISDKMEDLDIRAFDFVFVDGDHTKASIIKDLQMVTFLTNLDSYILIDDIDDNNHEQRDFYHNELKPKNNFYEYEDWKIKPGLALIRSGDLTL